MTFNIEFTKSAIKLICGEMAHICRLCLGPTESEEMSIHEFVTIKTSYLNDKLTFLTIFEELRMSPKPSLPDVLCPSCATITVNAYMFQKLCEYSQLQWENSLSSIDKSISQSTMLNVRAKNAYFIVGQHETTMLTDHMPITEESKKEKKIILSRIKKSMRGRIKSIKAKKKIHQNKYPCTLCSKIFLHAYELQDHKERIHYPKDIKCDECSEMFSTKKQLHRHKNVKHVQARCKLCGLEVQCKRSLKSHMDQHYKNSCSRCKREFQNRNSFRKHVRTCGHIFICDICNKKYAQKKTLQSHLKTDHGFCTNILSCNWCGKKYDRESKLKGHIVKHTRERNFTCEICGGKFVTKPALTYHLRLHTGEKPYPCGICDEHFLSSSRKMTHIRKVHLAPSEKCDSCDAIFVTRRALKYHKRRHENPNSKLFIPKMIFKKHKN